ncbi:MAG: hypothetical protein CMJ33_00700 [Phycisphaerae bacterium]|nr:hypothetical protein [Phycisphaerae bacterium]HAW95933.1 hypothetical protein [Phycisphaerales bacterium]
MKKISVVIADDHPSQRKFLLDAFEDERSLEVMDDVGTASEAIDSVMKHDPDVLVLDIEMPGLDVFHAAEEICRLKPEVKIIFLSGYYKDHDIASALRVNAQGYVSKSDDALLIIDAIACVMKNKRYFSPAIEKRLVENNGHVSTRTEMLSTREWETLEYVAKGYSKKEIAGFLHISVKTVEKHTQSVMNKLDVHDRVLLALWYLAHLKSLQ